MASELTRLSEALDALDEVSDYMSIPIARVFLSIVEREGEKQIYYHDRTKIPTSRLSRYMAVLMEGRRGVVGMNLVRERPDGEDYRAKRYFLTDAGTVLASQLQSLIRDPSVA